jgi:hypothetical protein
MFLTNWLRAFRNAEAHRVPVSSAARRKRLQTFGSLEVARWLDQLEDRTLLVGPNEPPVNAVPGPQSTQMNTPLAFTDFRENRITTSDADAGLNPVVTTLTAEHGVITLIYRDPNGGLTYSVGDGTEDATMTFSGKLTDINEALSWVVFQPDADYVGTEASLTITTNDQGFFGTGGAQEDVDSVSIHVTVLPEFEDLPPNGDFNPTTLDPDFGTQGQLVVSQLESLFKIVPASMPNRLLLIGSHDSTLAIMRIHADSWTPDADYGQNGVMQLSGLGAPVAFRELSADSFQLRGRNYLAAFDYSGSPFTGLGGASSQLFAGSIGTWPDPLGNVYHFRDSGNLYVDIFTSSGALSSTVNLGFANSSETNILREWRHGPVFGTNDDGTIDVASVYMSRSFGTFSTSLLERYYYKRFASTGVSISGAGGPQFREERYSPIPHSTLYGQYLPVRGIAQRDGKRVVVDGFGRVSRFRTDGLYDVAFSADGIVSASVLEPRLQPTQYGTLLLLGHIDNGANDDAALQVLLPDGAPDTRYGTAGVLTFPELGNGYASAAHFQEDGKLIVASIEADGLVVRRVLADYRYNEPPTLDPLANIITTDGTERSVPLLGISAGGGPAAATRV